MLESMTKANRPTRAEITDLGFALDSHADSVMLSGETGIGQFVLETVDVMRDMCRKVESVRDYQQHFYSRFNKKDLPAKI